MAISYKWVIAGRELAHGQKGDAPCDGEGVAEDVEAVSTALTRAIRLAYARENPETVARVLTAYWGPLRHRMLTDGVTATRSGGGHWQSSAGPISVELWCL